MDGTDLSADTSPLHQEPHEPHEGLHAVTQLPAAGPVLPAATESLVNVCVQKMMQRSKLAFGNVETGRAHKSFPINVVIPNGKEASPVGVKTRSTLCAQVHVTACAWALTHTAHS